MKRRSELKQQLSALERENAKLKAALLQRVNLFVAEYTPLGTWYITTLVKETGASVLLKKEFRRACIGPESEKFKLYKVVP